MINPVNTAGTPTIAPKKKGVSLRTTCTNPTVPQMIKITHVNNTSENRPIKGCGKTHIHRVAMENPITEIIPDNLSVGIREILDRKI